MNLRLLGRWIVGIELLILVGIVIHAPISVITAVYFPEYDLLGKVWKELLMGIAFALLIVYISLQKQWSNVLRDRIIQVVAAYALLHFLLLVWNWQGVAAASAGLLIDLRYVLYFVLVYTTLTLLPHYRTMFIKVAIAGALIVLGFTLLQSTILPYDVLKYIGYSDATIKPYLTVDLNYDYIRLNSTLRGPNPLGAYAAVCLALCAAYILQHGRSLSHRTGLLVGFLTLTSLLGLWASYSRSAGGAVIVMLIGVGALLGRRYITRTWWITIAVVICAGIGGIVASHESDFVQNVIRHSNPDGGSAQKSDDGHIDSLEDGTNRAIRQPLGGGIGSTGSASLQGDDPLIIENQYLFIAHESGWLGVLLFIVLSGLIYQRLWQVRRQWFAVGVGAGGIGLAAIGLLQPVWADDTVSIVWWGLAAVAITATTHRVTTKATIHSKRQTKKKPHAKK
ncbi:O-antigen ligase domain-containing protein [bacterium]|nr:MAG: O-antigen ligase domain-containing protein [bacterium]